MAVSVLRGLDILEAVGMGDVGVSELARRTGFDKASVSRTVKALVEAGWLFRDGDTVRLGARAYALGGSTPQREAINRADELVKILSGLTQMSCFATQLFGTHQAVMAATQGPGMPEVAADGSQYPTFLTVSGLCLLAALPEDDAEAALADVSLDAFVPGSVSGVDQLRDDVARARQGACITDRGRGDPAFGCIAKRWEVPQLPQPMSLAVLGPLSRIDDELELIQRLLEAATEAGADRRSLVAAMSA